MNHPGQIDRPEPVRIDEICSDAIDRCRLAAQAKRIDVVLGGDEGAVVYGDHALLVTAVRNLVDNAISYSADDTKVGVAVRRAGGVAEVAVSDQGIGIPATEQERIFEGPVWHYIGLEAEVPKPGDFVTTYVGTAPVILSRTSTGGLAAFLNRCAHRGALVTRERRGNCTAHVCIYHQWTYDHEGNLVSVPYRRGIAGVGGFSSFLGAVVASRATRRFGIGRVAIMAMLLSAVGNAFIPLAPAGLPLVAVACLVMQQLVADSAVTVYDITP